MNDRKNVKKLYEVYSGYTSEYIKEILEGGNENSEDYDSILACNMVLRERASEGRKSEVFSKLQAQLIVIFTGILAAEAFYNLVRNATKTLFQP